MAPLWVGEVALSERDNTLIEHAWKLGKPRCLVAAEAGKDDRPKMVKFQSIWQRISKKKSLQPTAETHEQEIRRTSFTFMELLGRAAAQFTWWLESGGEVNIVANPLEKLTNAEENFKKYNSGYKESGIFAGILRSAAFTTIRSLAILLNTIWLGVDAEYNTASSYREQGIGFQVVDNLFCVWFVFDVLVEVLAYKNKLDAIRQPLLLFDALLSLLYVFDVWVARVASGLGVQWFQSMSGFRAVRIIRIARLPRILHILKFIPGAQPLIVGCVKAMETATTTFLALVLVTYVFAIVLKNTAFNNKEMEDYFPSMFTTMSMLVLHGALLDAVSDVAYELVAMDKFACLVFVIYILIVNFTLLNMLIGLLESVVSDVENSDQDDRRLARMKNEMLEYLTAFAENAREEGSKQNSETIEKSEYDRLMQQTVIPVLKTNDLSRMTTSQKQENELSFTNVLKKNGVDTDEFKHLMDQHVFPLSFDDVINTAVSMRSDSPVCVGDLYHFRQKLEESREKKFERIEKSLSKAEEILSKKNEEGISSPPPAPTSAIEDARLPPITDEPPQWARNLEKNVAAIQGKVEQFEKDIGVIRKLLERTESAAVPHVVPLQNISG